VIPTVERAIRIGKYLIPHAQAAFAEMGADAVVEQAKTILRWIEHQNARQFTKRDVRQALRVRFKRVEELDAPLPSHYQAFTVNMIGGMGSVGAVFHAGCLPETTKTLALTPSTKPITGAPAVARTPL
jgi:hypothetical protein